MIKGQDGYDFKVTKGAPQVILALDTNAARIQSRVDQVVNDFAARGFGSSWRGPHQRTRSMAVRGCSVSLSTHCVMTLNRPLMLQK